MSIRVFRNCQATIFWVLALYVGIGFVTSCGSSKSNKSNFREYVEITSGGGVFGNQGSSAVINQQATSQEIELFNQVTFDANLSKGVSWEVPQGWREVKETGVRLVSFKTLHGQEVTLIPFPGAVGGISANIRRWLDQVEVKLTDDELQEIIKKIEITNNQYELPYILVDFQSYVAISSQQKTNTILAAIFGFRDQMLFVKVLGDKAAILKDRKEFQFLLNSIKIQK